MIGNLRHLMCAFFSAIPVALSVAQGAPGQSGIVKPTVIDYPDYEPISKAKGLQAGETGIVQLEVCVDEKGNTTSATLAEPSGNARLDEVGLALASQFRFKPGTVNGKRAAQCIPLGVRVPPLREEAAADKPVKRMAQVTYRPPFPTFEGDRVKGAASGRVVVKLCLDKAGKIQETTLAQSSGSDYLDNIALTYARRHRFAPATVDGKPEASCPNLPVDFVLLSQEPLSKGDLRNLED
ncbi:MAG: TonB family protein [Chloroflexota bacterium]|nr:TonB family protein [Chloroflexota bacterium]